MRLKFVTAIVTLFLLTTACIPILRPIDGVVEVTAVRSGDVVTATLVLGREATEVAIVWIGEELIDPITNEVGRSTHLIGDVVPPGTYESAVIHDGVVDCSAIGYLGRRQFTVFCAAPDPPEVE